MFWNRLPANDRDFRFGSFSIKDGRFDLPESLLSVSSRRATLGNMGKFSSEFSCVEFRHKT